MLALLRFINNKSKSIKSKAEQSQGFAGSKMLRNNLRWIRDGIIIKNKKKVIYIIEYTQLVHFNETSYEIIFYIHINIFNSVHLSPVSPPYYNLEQAMVGKINYTQGSLYTGVIIFIIFMLFRIKIFKSETIY